MNKSRCLPLFKNGFSQEVGVFFLGLALILFGLKLLVIAHYGSATPYWDQWDVEAANLYKPFLEGTWTFGQFFEPHNEHRMLTTRLLALLLLEVNGIWNPLLEMVCNALLHVVAILTMVGILLHALGKKVLLPLLFFSVVLFGLPYGWDNTVTACNAHFYCTLIFSVIALFLLIEKRVGSLSWWLGVASGGIAFFSLASGVFALAAGAAVLAIQYLLTGKRSWRQLLGALLLMLLFLAGLLLTPTIAGHAPLKAHSIRQFGAAFITIMSWPLPGNFGWFIFRNLPSLFLCLHLFLLKPARNDRRWFLLGFVLWTWMQGASIAYGRAEGVLASRYLDLFSLSVLVNFAVLLGSCPFRTIVQKSITAAWALIVAIALLYYCYKALPGQLSERKSAEVAQTLHVQNYQHSGDISDLNKRPFFEIPYPDHKRLAEILSSPSIQKILPSTLQKNSAEYPLKEGTLDGFVSWLLAHALYFIVLGVALWVLCAVRSERV